MKHHIFSLVAALTLAAGVSTAQAQIQPIRPGGGIVQPLGGQLLQQMAMRASINANLLLKSPSISAARGPLGTAQLGQLVTVQGFYYDGSVPMIVDDIDRTRCDMMMPAPSYVPLAARVENLRNGDEVSIKGRLVAPATAGVRFVDEPSVLSLEGDAKADVQVVRPRGREMMKVTPNTFRIPNNIFVKPTKYAVLIIGGGNEANNHIRYWNDLKTMYAILRGRGYSKSNITVIYANGTARDNSVPVDFSASKANINTVFKNLGDKMGVADDLYIMINDHGGGFLSKQVGSYSPGTYGAILDTGNSIGTAWSEKTYNLDLNYDGDKNDMVHFHNTVCLWGELMTDTEFAAALDQVKNYNTEMIQMKQCFSGGFTRALSAPKRVVMSSAAPDEVSWSNASATYGEFTYHYFTALTGKIPDGDTTANADANGDGKISMLEAWNYARTKDSQPETGWYADTATTPATGDMPGGGQGVLGATTIP